MKASRPLRIVCVFALTIIVTCAASVPETTPVINKNEFEVNKIEIFDGFHVNIPKDNSTGKLLSFEIDTNEAMESGRGKKGKKTKLMGKLLPLFIMPFLIQSSIVPLFLGMLKFMLFKSLMVGKLALALIVLNAFKNHNSVKGREAEMADVHYGYHGNGMEEYGAYIHS